MFITTVITFKKGKVKLATHIAMVVDESGSMYPLRTATLGGFDEYVQDLQKDDADEAFLTLVKFNTHANTVFTARSIEKVEALDKIGYAPSGGTALYDAISYAVGALEGKLNEDDRAVVVVITDGYENSSKETNRDQILDLITSKEETGDWTFAYMGANQDAWAVGTSMGFTGYNTFSYAANATGVAASYSTLASSTSNLRGTSKGSQEYYDVKSSFLTNPEPSDKLWVPGETEETTE